MRELTETSLVLLWISCLVDLESIGISFMFIWQVKNKLLTYDKAYITDVTTTENQSQLPKETIDMFTATPTEIPSQLSKAFQSQMPKANIDLFLENSAKSPSKKNIGP